MAAFPDIPVTIGSQSSLYIPIVQTESEGNYLRVRRKTTRSRRIFTLDFKEISYTDYALIEAFFEANQGISFTWTHPVTSIEYDLVFMQDTLVQTMGATSCDTSILVREI